MVLDHEHNYDGPILLSRLAGTPHRPCTLDACSAIELPIEDDEDDEDFYGDRPEVERDETHRAFCETGDCGWSSELCDSDEQAHGYLVEHLGEFHPGEPDCTGSVDRT